MGKKKRRNKNVLRVTIVIIVIVIIVGAWLLNLYLLKEKTFDDRGSFGDMFGPINALYSGLAIAGIILTLIIQRDEMKLQDSELRIQRFESTLFNLLGLHQQIVTDLFSKGSVKGRNVFKNLYLMHGKNLKKTYPIVFDDEVEDDLGHYFRNIFRIVKFIDQADFSQEGIVKKRYRQVKFLRSQLSTYELVWICYWGMTENGKKLKIFIERYSLLKHMPKSFKENATISKHYDNQAFTIHKEYRDKKRNK